MHLIDTSVWIDFLRGVSNPRVQLLEGLLEEGEAYLCDITYAEICFGAKDQRQFRKYERIFAELPFLSLPENWHREIARLGYALKSKGHKSYVADLMIGLAALHHRAALLTRDKDFEAYHDLFGLTLE